MRLKTGDLIFGFTGDFWLPPQEFSMVKKVQHHDQRK
jgi:hypothetical protein